VFRLNPEYDLFLIGWQITGIDIKGDKMPVENVQHG
jgi:hypothetical protein